MSPITRTLVLTFLSLVSLTNAQKTTSSIRPLTVETYKTSILPLAEPTENPVNGQSADPPNGNNQYLPSGVQSSLSLGAVLGITIGVFLFVLAIIALSCLLSWRRREAKRGLQVTGITKQEYDAEKRLNSWQREKKKIKDDSSSGSGSDNQGSEVALIPDQSIDISLPSSGISSMPPEMLQKPIPIQVIPIRTDSNQPPPRNRAIERSGTPASISSSITIGIPSTPTPSTTPAPSSPARPIVYYTRDAQGNLYALPPRPSPPTPYDQPDSTYIRA